MDYIAVLDYEHLDNGVFLASFARSLSQQQGHRGIIIHGDSAYTERLIQTGIMRDEARIRAVKDLNHRLIALLADHGVSAIGLNGYQRSLIESTGRDILIDSKQLRLLPSQPHLLLSSLVSAPGKDEPEVLSLARYAKALQNNLDIDDLIIFSLEETDEIFENKWSEKMRDKELDEEFKRNKVPVEFRNESIPAVLTTADLFANYPKMGGILLNS